MTIPIVVLAIDDTSLFNPKFKAAFREEINQLDASQTRITKYEIFQLVIKYNQRFIDSIVSNQREKAVIILSTISLIQSKAEDNENITQLCHETGVARHSAISEIKRGLSFFYILSELQYHLKTKLPETITVKLDVVLFPDLLQQQPYGCTFFKILLETPSQLPSPPKFPDAPENNMILLLYHLMHRTKRLYPKPTLEIKYQVIFSQNSAGMSKLVLYYAETKADIPQLTTLTFSEFKEEALQPLLCIEKNTYENPLPQFDLDELVATEARKDPSTRNSNIDWNRSPHSTPSTCFRNGLR